MKKEIILLCGAENTGKTTSIRRLFEKIHVEAEINEVFVRQMNAQKLMTEIVTSQIETGTPYMLYKDSINKKSNQKNIGIINSSNLCFTGDTMVAIQSKDERNAVSIKELAEESQGKKKIPVWSGLDKKRRLKNSHKVISSYSPDIKNAIAFKTGRREVIKITLSNGGSFKCTRDHELALIDGGYIKASESLNYELEPFTLVPTIIKVAAENSVGTGEYSSVSVTIPGIPPQKSSSVVKIEDAGVEDVYDLTVEDNHNFYIITSTEDDKYLNCQGVLVHNCAEIVEHTN